MPAVPSAFPRFTPPFSVSRSFSLLVNARRQAVDRPFAHRVITRRTEFAVPGGDDVQRAGSEPADRSAVSGIQEICSALATDRARNTLIEDDVIAAIRAGRSPVVLTERREAR